MAQTVASFAALVTSNIGDQCRNAVGYGLHVSASEEAHVTTVADALAQALKDEQIDTVFGLPGGENVEVLARLQQHGLRFILVHNESSAVYMAAVTARLIGKPGVCLTTLGPGAANAIAGVGHAYLDRAPVLIITAHMPQRLESVHTHQTFDQTALFAPITKQSQTLGPVNARATVEAALKLTMAGRPGPVHLQISRETATQTVTEAPPVPDSPPEVELDSDNITLARQQLADAQRPVIIAGLGIEPEGCYAELRSLAETINAPVITTPKAKGAIAHTHPLAAGSIGLTRTDPIYDLMAEADCIIAVGFDVVELVKPWDETAPLIWIAPWPNHDPHIPAVVECVGPMQPVLQALTTVESAVADDWGQVRVAAHQGALAQRTLPEPVTGRMRPQAVLRAVRASVPDDTLVSVDVGSHKILTSLMWPDHVPNRFMLSNGLSCMGYGLPAAIAASLALGNQPTVCITGDAGLAMVIGELELISRLGAPVIVVVMNDSALDLIRAAQIKAGKQVWGTEFANPDFVKLADAYRIEACRVHDEAACAQAVLDAITHQRPALIEAMIDPASYPTAPGM